MRQIIFKKLIKANIIHCLDPFWPHYTSYVLYKKKLKLPKGMQTELKNRENYNFLANKRCENIIVEYFRNKNYRSRT
jgi:hypothetical protein